MGGRDGILHYYQFNIGDYKSHTEHLSEMEDLAYRRLLDWYYLHETPIPLDIGETSRQIRMRSHTDCIATVLQEYFERTDTGWIQGRADKEIAKMGDKSAKAAESARRRWDKEANAMRTHSEGNATHNTLPITQDTLKEPKGSSPVNRTPSQQLLELFHEKAQLLPRVTVFNEPRRKVLQARYREVMAEEKWTAEQTIDWFGTFYGIVNDSAFLTGRSQPGRDGRVFKADWDWIHGPKNFVKIVEGKYSGD